MLIDLETVTDPIASVQRSTICIAGAGIAGLVLAVASADAGMDVHLLEAGGRKDEEQSQEIYDAQMADTQHFGTTLGRFRVFGGSSTRWGGQLLPFTADTFSPPAALSTVGWPLSADALEPFYHRIQQILGTNDLPFTADLLERVGKTLPRGFHLHPEIDLRFSKWAPFSHRNLAKTVGKEAMCSPRIIIYLHANLTECLLAPDGSKVEAFLARNYRGACFRFIADQYVMATGTIETSRLLLASRSVCLKGVGNLHDQLGRRFHDHVSAPVAELNAIGRKTLLPWMGPFFVGGTMHTARIEATTSLRRQLNLPAMMAHLEIKEPEDSGTIALRHVLRCVQRGDIKSALLVHSGRFVTASLDILRLVYNLKFRRRRVASSRATILLQVSCGQHAHAANRIRLNENYRDRFGLPKAVVDWRISANEMSSMRRYARWLKTELLKLGINAFDWYPHALADVARPLSNIRDTNHAMGGTTMGIDPTDSIVDRNLRVHGVANLHIASCSTYPVGSTSNPTFTLMALTLRLAERLKHLTGRSC